MTNRSSLGKKMDRAITSLLAVAAPFILFAVAGLRMPTATLLAIPAAAALLICLTRSARALDRRREERARKEQTLRRAVEELNARSPAQALAWVLPAFSGHNGLRVTHTDKEWAICERADKRLLFSALPCPANEPPSACAVSALMREARSAGAAHVALLSTAAPGSALLRFTRESGLDVIWLGRTHLESLLNRLALPDEREIKRDHFTNWRSHIFRPERIRPCLLYGALLAVFSIVTGSALSAASALTLVTVAVVSRAAELSQRRSQAQPFDL